MVLQHRFDSKVLWVLGLGFGLIIAVLLGSAYTGIEALERVETRRMNLVQEHRISTKLIGEIQGEEAGLSSVFYALARSPQLSEAERRPLMARLAAIEKDVQRTLHSALAQSRTEHWKRVKRAVEEFIDEGRRALLAPGEVVKPSADLYRRHEELLTELTALVSTNYARALASQTEEDQHSRDHLRNALVLLGIGLVLSVICAVATVHFAGQVLRRARWQANELARLSSHVLESQETTVRRISRELHDEFGQILSAIEANLSVIPAQAPEVAPRVEDCLLLVKDAMSNVRELSQLLRPSILDDFGLGPGLEWLADSFTQRTGIEVALRMNFDGRLPDETETHLFRIAQEALTNVGRQSGATRAEVSLERNGKHVALVIADNGHGFASGNGRRGFGLIGMRERVRSAGGELQIESTPAGVTIRAEVPFEYAAEQSKNPSAVSG